MPEIIRFGQGSKTSNQGGIKFPDFQEANPLVSRPFHTDPHVLGEVNAINTDQNRGSLSVELFEEKLEEINQDLSKFDMTTEFSQNQTLPRVRKIIWNQ